MVGDKPHSAHIGGKRVNFLDAARRLQAIIPTPQIKNFKFVSVGLGEFWIFDVHAAHPVIFVF